MDTSMMMKLLLSTSLWLSLSPIDFVSSNGVDEKVCTLVPGGVVTLFSGETTLVTLPCKYRLADMTCGDFRVKVVPGSAADDQGRFNPSTLWLKIENMNTGVNATVRTSMAMLTGQRPSIRNSYVVKAGDITQVAQVDLNVISSFLRFSAAGQYSVELDGEKGTVRVKCSSQIFNSRPVPQTLCGDGTTQDAFKKAAEMMPGDASDLRAQPLLHYIILSDDTIRQSASCRGLASKFRSCDNRTFVAMTCSALFAEPTKARCLSEALEKYYHDCLVAVCDGGSMAVERFRQFLNDTCPSDPPVPTTDNTTTVCPDSDSKGWLYLSCRNDSVCPAANTECVSEIYCACSLGFLFSESRQCCVDTCDELYTGEVTDSFTARSSTRFDCGEGVLAHALSERRTCLEDCLKMPDCVTAIENEDTKECTLCKFGPGSPQVTMNVTANNALGIHIRKCV